MKQLKERSSVSAALYDKYIVAFLAVLIFVIVLSILFAGDDIGLSDNGDFGRVMNASSLIFRETDKSFTYIDEYAISLTGNSALGNIFKILFSAEGVRDYPSIQIVFVRISVIVNLFINKLTGSDMSVYRLGVLGVMYAVMYTAALSLLLAQFRLKNRIADFITKCAVIVVLCDIGYVSYFNSFYGEALQHTAFIFCTAMLLRFLLHRPKKRDMFFGAAGAVVYGCSKFFNIPLACLFIIAYAGIFIVKSRDGEKTGKGAAVIMPAAVGAVSVCLLAAAFLSVPSWMVECNVYNTVFYGVVRELPEQTAAGYLEELGLPAEMAVYKDTNYFVRGIPESLDENGFADDLRSVSEWKVLFFYLKHPARLWHQLGISVRHCGMIRPFYLANLGGSHPRMTLSSRFSLWSSVRQFLSFDSAVGNLAVVAAFLAAGIFCSRAKIGRVRLIFLCCLLGAALAYSFAVPIITNGEADLAKHMFAFVEFIDVLFIAVLVCSVGGITERGGKIAIPAICVFLAAALVLPGVSSSVSHAISENKNHSGLERFSYVSFGKYGDGEIVWLVAECGDDSAILLSAGPIEISQYDSGNSNAWDESGIRKWLNGSFLESFNKTERSLMLPQDNSVILSVDEKHKASSGYLDFYCSHIASLAARGYESAYRIMTEDIVTLPDIDLISRLASDGHIITCGKDYWLETPYFNNNYMVRYVSRDGNIYFGEAKTEKAVRAVIRISISDEMVSGGTGSIKDPFRLSVS